MIRSGLPGCGAGVRRLSSSSGGRPIQSNSGRLTQKAGAGFPEADTNTSTKLTSLQITAPTTHTHSAHLTPHPTQPPPLTRTSTPSPALLSSSHDEPLPPPPRPPPRPPLLHPPKPPPPAPKSLAQAQPGLSRGLPDDRPPRRQPRKAQPPHPGRRRRRASGQPQDRRVCAEAEGVRGRQQGPQDAG